MEVQTAGMTVVVPKQNGAGFQTAELAPVGLVDAHRFREVCLNLKKGVYKPRAGGAQPVMVNPSLAFGPKHDGISGLPFVPIAQPVPGALSMSGAVESKETTQLLRDLNATMTSVDSSLKQLVQQQQQLIAQQQQQQRGGAQPAQTGLTSV